MTYKRGARVARLPVKQHRRELRRGWVNVGEFETCQRRPFQLPGILPVLSSGMPLSLEALLHRDAGWLPFRLPLPTANCRGAITLTAEDSHWCYRPDDEGGTCHLDDRGKHYPGTFPPFLRARGSIDLLQEQLELHRSLKTGTTHSLFLHRGTTSRRSICPVAVL